MTTEEDIVRWGADLPGPEWRRLTTAMSWLHRRGSDLTDVPPELKGVAHIVIDSETWDKLRRRVRTIRHQAYRDGRKAQLEAAELRRRDYMRVYMTNRRRQTTNGTSN